MKDIKTSIAIRQRSLTINERYQLESTQKRAARINAGRAEEGDRDPGRLFADLEFLLSLIEANEVAGQARSPSHFSRSFTEQSPTEFSKDIAKQTNDLLDSANNNLLDLL